VENGNVAGKARKAPIRRLLKIVLTASVMLVAVIQILGWAWRFSGTNQWELFGERKGVRVYTLKTPGSDLNKFKCVFRVRSTLSGLVRLMQDPDACDDLQCYGSRIIEKVDDHLQYATFRYKFDRPFRPREYVVRTEIHQNALTKEVLVSYSAALGKIPPDDCCFRVSDFNNAWRLTPLGNGQVDVEYTVNMDEGGLVPNVIANRARPKFLLIALRHLQKILDKDKYRNAKLAFIQER